ncbi:AGE family epimerase/isomerase [Sphingobacterium sp.]|uniref:AGE family epimerase/isomerase n=1 Tax=Sphingobacterium sp. TaxID=341027 RepID=UPI00289C227D|nr:AGE family epimerase/isomerase [Sphingobacterium sp.]
MRGFKEEIENNILPYWMDKMVDTANGGFFGRIDGNNVLHRYANKGVVMHARILWTFSAAYRVLRRDAYRQIAERAYCYLRDYFLDKQYGGVYWQLDFRGHPVNRKKQTYAQGFALYAFSEYYRATGCSEALDYAKKQFYQIERCKDDNLGGYREAFTEDWQPIADMRLSAKDENEAKTMNTHLHILEPYTNLLRIWMDEDLMKAQADLITLFLERIYSEATGHLQLFFDETWQVKGEAQSFGHDIEAVWLLLEAAKVLGDPDLLEKVKAAVIPIGHAALQGILPDGGLAYERKGGHWDRECHWWVQAEAVLGFSYLGQMLDDGFFQEKAESIWSYIQSHMVDHEGGEWYWSRLENGKVNDKEDKAGFWKCPYHNGRMCLEMIENFRMI